VVPGQPALVLDVAHNPQAVAALALNLDAMGFFPRTQAVFAALRDKDIAGLLPRMVPLVDVWHCCALPTPRAMPVEELAAVVRSATVGRSDVVIHLHDSPAAALSAAAAMADPTDRIVVFGSFYTVGGVLKKGLPRLTAAHVG
jgi:dihydrofolate synthase/folylpolyglutamate synthase